MPTKRLVAALSLVSLAVAAVVILAAPTPSPQPAPTIVRTSLVPLAEIRWPAGTSLIDFENLEGLILFDAYLKSTNGADTTGILVFDSGAGYLALDHELAWMFGLTARREARDAINVVRQPLQRLSIGPLQMDHVTPLLTYGAQVVKSVTDRPVVGLLGQRPLTGRAIWIDYSEEQFAIVPVPQSPRSSRTRASDRLGASRDALGSLASSRAHALAFRMMADGKIVVQGRVSDPAPPRYSDDLVLIVDTGATWSVLSESALQRYIDNEKKWETLEGYSAPTLFGENTARVSRIPRVLLRGDGEDIALDDVDTAILGGDLFQLLSEGVGRRIDGVVGYTFLKQFRVGIDYVNRVLWLDPMPTDWEYRPYRDSHIGVQLHRVEGEIRIEAILKKSPAEEAGLRIGDPITAVDGKPADQFDVMGMLRYLEDRPGTQVDITVRRGARERTYVVVRRSLF